MIKDAHADDFGLLKTDPYKRKSKRKSIKVLTIVENRHIMRPVKTLKRKDDLAMTTTNKIKTVNWSGSVKSVAWLAFALQQAFISYILLRNFDNTIIVAAAFVSLGIAGLIVLVHFFKANK